MRSSAALSGVNAGSSRADSHNRLNTASNSGAIDFRGVTRGELEEMCGTFPKLAAFTLEQCSVGRNLLAPKPRCSDAEAIAGRVDTRVIDLVRITCKHDLGADAAPYNDRLHFVRFGDVDGKDQLVVLKLVDGQRSGKRTFVSST